VPHTTRRTRAAASSLHSPSALRSRVAPLAVLALVLVASACDSRAQRGERAHTDAPRTAAAGLVAGPGSPAHALYESKGFTCDVCHPCGTRSADGHAVEWMDQASAGFHAIAANRNLAGCAACHGAALDGVGGGVSVSCAPCHGAGWKSDCTMCHGAAGSNGAPPKATWGNSADAVRVGAHAAHLGATHGLAKPVACVDCHVVPTDALSPGHADGTTATVKITGLGARVALPPAWDRATATCNGTYCHGGTLGGGAAKAPIWTRADGTDRACNACHGSPPPAPHAQNPDCGQCHPGYGPTSVDPAIHIDGKLDVANPTCSSCHGSAANDAPPRGTRNEQLTTELAVGAHQAHLAAGALSNPIACAECHVVPTVMTHSDGVASIAYGPLTTARGAQASWDRATATCTNYCHGQFPGGAALNAVKWTKVDGTQAACGTCHGLPPAAPHPQNPACGSCHDGYTQTSVNLATHVNGVPDVKALTCSSCHGSATNAAPPSGTHGEQDPSARAVGAHQAHLAGGTLGPAVACAECHVVPTDMTHADGTVQVALTGKAATGGAVPAYDATTATCQNTYCHGATLRGGGLNTAPLWTGGVSQVTCGSCHTTPPPAPHPHTAICENCHPGYTMTSVNLATHINGKVESENLTCSSCHGDDSRVLTMGADPNAIAAPPYGSRGETDVASRSVGSHQAHVNRGNSLSLPAKCKYCHVVPTTTDHSNGVTELTFGSLAKMGGANPTFDGNTCKNTYCHGATLNRGGTDHEPNWVNPKPVTCGSCHGVPPPAPHPQDADCIRCHPGYTQTSVRKWTHVNGISDFPSGCNSCHDDPPNTGAHYEHLYEHITCDKCHAGYTSTSENKALHRNAVIDVTLNGWNASTHTCSNVGCHGSEYWGRSGSAARQSCNQCHGVPPASGEHYEHKEYACSRCHGTGYSTTTVNTATHMSGVVDVPFAFYNRATATCGGGTGSCHGSERWGQRSPVTPNCGNCHGYPPPLPHPQQSSCQDCHPSMTSSGVLTATHNNGTLDISGHGCESCHGFPPSSTRAGGTHPQDQNCCGCHSTTVNAQNQVVSDGTHNDGAVQVGGGGVGTYGCQSCHGDQARTLLANADPQAKSAPPLGTRGETEETTRAVGAHVMHLNKDASAGAIARPAACAECHVVPTTLDHANGVVVNTFSGRAVLQGASPVFELATFTCQNTYCHGATLGAGGTNHAPSWNEGPSQATCGTCHGVPPPAPHSQSANCGGCHDGYTATTVNLAAHVDGQVQISPAACNACHGSAQNAAPPSGTRGESLTTELAVGAHQQHLQGGALAGPVACASCHVVPTSASHEDGTAQVAFGGVATTGGAAPAWNRATATCSATYCHGQFVGGNLLNAPTWTKVDGTQAACGSCHGVPPPAPHAQSADCGACHPGYTGTSVDLASHVNGTVDVILTCTSCHGTGTNAAPPAGTHGETATTTRAVGAHQAHLQGGTLAGPVACSECHVVPASTSHESGVVELAWGTLARTGGAVPVWNGTTCASTYCHGATLAAGGTLTAPSWTKVDGTQDACGTCHGNPPPAPHSSSTACGSCHDGYTSTSVNLALHVNGKVEAKSPHPAGFADKAQHGYQVNLTGLSGCKSCHGANLDGVGGTAQSCKTCHATAGFATWDTNCTFCHGNRTTGVQSPPVDIQGRTVTTNVSVGVHASHQTTTIANAIACGQCHPARTASVITDAAHIDGNGIAEVAFGALAKTGGVTPVYTRSSATSATCASTYCHGKFTGGTSATVSWTSTTQVGCTSCHGNPPATGKHTSVGSHSSRPCGDCHGVGYTNSAVVKATHVDGIKQIGNSLRTYNPSTRTCTSSCHGSQTW